MITPRALLAPLLALVALAPIGRADTPARPVVGDWEGDLKVSPQVSLKIVLHVEPALGGALKGNLDSPDQGAKGLPIDTITLEGDTLKLASKALALKFEGKLAADGKSIEGTWAQGPGKYPLTLAKADPAKPTTEVVVPDALAGIWEGTLHAGGTELRLAIHATKDKSGKIDPTFESIDQGAKDIHFSSFEVKGRDVAFAIRLIGATYKGTLDDAKTSIVGKFTQSGTTFPLDFKKTDKLTEVRRPQTPKPPFPYNSTNVSYDNSAAKIKLAGTLTTPKGDGPFPAVLLITGSGAQDRDETLFGHKPFLVLADALTRRGVAVLRVDDRGVGGSSGDMMTSTSEDFAGDVQAGILFLKTRPEIDTRRIGLMGHSEGGLIAPMVAAKSTDVAFIVLLAGTGLNGREILQMQSRLIAKAAGASDAALDKADKRLAIVLDRIKGAKDDAEAQGRLRDLAKEIVAGLPDEEKKALGADPEAGISGSMKAFTSPWFRYFLTYEPRESLAKVTCPVLAVNGALDLQVPPDENLKTIEAALRSGGNDKVTTRKFEGLNHLFQHAKTGSPSEYNKIEETFAPEALDAIVSWVVEQTGAK